MYPIGTEYLRGRQTDLLWASCALILGGGCVGRRIGEGQAQIDNDSARVRYVAKCNHKVASDNSMIQLEYLKCER